MDDGLLPGDITAEDLYSHGWSSDSDCIVWWKYEDEEKYTFDQACEIYSDSRIED